MRIEPTLDCVDLDVTARFWAAALGCTSQTVVEGWYTAISSDAITLTLQRVPEPKSGKNRMHLDLLVADVPAEVGRLESLGATRLTTRPREQYGQIWYVMGDPEGNEFCVARDPDRL